MTCGLGACVVLVYRMPYTWPSFGVGYAGNFLSIRVVSFCPFGELEVVSALRVQALRSSDWCCNHVAHYVLMLSL